MHDITVLAGRDAKETMSLTNYILFQYSEIEDIF